MACTAQRQLLQRGSSLLLAATVGCATPPQDPKQAVTSWLEDAPRALAIEVAAEYPPPTRTIVIRDHRIGERAVVGALAGGKGAVVTTFGGCLYVAEKLSRSSSNDVVGGIALILVGCTVGLAASPFVFIYKAGEAALSIESRDASKAVAAKEAGGLFTASGKRIELPEALGRAVAAEAARQGRHALSPVSVGSRDRSGKEPLLRLAVTSLELVGPPDDKDPVIAWNIGVVATIRAPGVAKGEVEWQALTYRGEKALPLSEWGSDEARAFREEIQKAAQFLAEALVKNLPLGPR